MASDLRSWSASLWKHSKAVAVTGAAPAALGVAQAVGHFQIGLPWWGWLNIAGGALFVAAFRAWREMKVEHDKLAADIASLRDEIRYGLKRDGLEQVAGTGLKFLVPLRNFASVPVRYEMRSISFSVTLAGLYPTSPSRSEMAGASAVVAAGQIDRFLFHAARVATGEIPARSTVNGILEFDLAFGPANGPSLYTMKEKIIVELYFDEPNVEADTIGWRSNSYSVLGYPILDSVRAE